MGAHRPLAHEPMQPIAAAVGNAEAGQRLLATEGDPDEARDSGGYRRERLRANIVSGVRSR